MPVSAQDQHVADQPFQPEDTVGGVGRRLARAAVQCRSPRKTCPPCLRVKAITLPVASRSKSISAPTPSATKISLSTDATSSGPPREPCTKSLAPVEKTRSAMAGESG